MKCLVTNFCFFLNGKLYPIGSVIDYPDNLPLVSNLKKIDYVNEQNLHRKRGRPRLIKNENNEEQFIYPIPEE